MNGVCNIPQQQGNGQFKLLPSSEIRRTSEIVVKSGLPILFICTSCGVVLFPKASVLDTQHTLVLPMPI